MFRPVNFLLFADSACDLGLPWARRHRRTVELNSKIPPKWDLKNSWNWHVILVPATVWQILNVKRRQPETEVMWICRNFHGKTREIATSELIFVADFSNLEPKCDPRPVPVNINYVLSTQVVQLETKGIAISQTIIWVRFSPAGVVSSLPPSTSPPSNSLF